MDQSVHRNKNYTNLNFFNLKTYACIMDIEFEFKLYYCFFFKQFLMLYFYCFFKPHLV